MGAHALGLAALASATGKVTVLWGAALLAGLLLRRRAASIRHMFWALAVSGALALPLLGALLPSWSWHVLPAEMETSAEVPARPTSAEVPSVPAALSSTDSARISEGPAHPRGTQLLFVWLAGAGLLMGRLAFARWRLHDVTRRASGVTDVRAERLRALLAERHIKRTVVLQESCDVGPPMTWGLMKPHLVLPLDSKNWPQARLDAVLVHELAHIQRLDAFTQLLAEIACALYWFHPLAWLAAQQMRTLREFACDDEVLAAGTRPSRYARDVLAILGALDEETGLRMVTAGMARPSQLKSRLEAVLNPSLERGRLAPQRGLAFASAFVVVVAGLAAIQPTRASAAPRAPTPPSVHAPLPVPTPPPALPPAVTTPSASPAVKTTAVATGHRKKTCSRSRQKGTALAPAQKPTS